MKKYLFILLFFAALPVFSQNIGKQNFEKGKLIFQKAYYDSASKFLTDASIYYERSQEWQGYLQASLLLVESYNLMYKLKAAAQEADKLVKNIEKNLGANSSQSAWAYYAAAQVNYYEGNYIPALRKYEHAYKLIENQGLAELEARIFLGKGDIFYIQDNYHESIKFYQKAQEIILGNLEADAVLTGEMYLIFGNYYRNQGSYSLALEDYDKALEIFKKHYGEKHPLIASVYIGIGDVNQYKGALDVAMDYYQQALIINKTFLGTFHPNYSDAYLGIADVYKAEGNNGEAFNYYNAALDLYDLTVGVYHPGVVRCFLGLGNVALNEGNYKEAISNYNQVLDINYDLRSEVHSSSSAALNNISSVYYFDAQYDIAIDYYERSLNIDLQIHGKKHPDVANAYYNIGKVYEERGNFEMALQFVQKAICASFSDFDYENYYLNPIFKNYFSANDILAFFKFKAETLEKGFKEKSNLRGLATALETFQLCDTLIEKIRHSHVSEKDKIVLGKVAHQTYTSALKAAYHLHQTTTTDNYKELMLPEDSTFAGIKKEFLRRIFYFSEKNKGAVLAASLAESKAKAFGGIPDNLLQEEENLRKQIAQYQVEIAAKPDSLTMIRYEELLFKVNRQYESLIDKLEKNYPKYYELKYDIQVASLDQVQSLLDEKTAMISYFMSDDRIFALFIRKDSVSIHQNLKHEDLEKVVRSIRNAIVYHVPEIFVRHASTLYQQFFWFDIPKNYERLILIPEGIMSNIPFEALLTERSKESDYQKMPYLLKKYAISYSFSADLFYDTFVKGDNDTKSAPKYCLAMAPVFTKSDITGFTADVKQTLDIFDTKKDAAPEQERGMSSNTRNAVRKLVSESGYIDPIPATEDEINAIHQEFTGKGLAADMFLHEQANENFVKTGNLHQYKYIHIATHGFVNEEQPELSGILLATDKNKKEDGILYSGEIYNLNLKSEMIVLSACETGLGKVSKGEGVIGLTRALLYAGSKNVLVSLWKVADKSTSELMINLYENLLQQHQDEGSIEDHTFALQKAKLKLIENPKYAEPYYWSPFVLIGQ